MYVISLRHRPHVTHHSPKIDTAVQIPDRSARETKLFLKKSRQSDRADDDDADVDRDAIVANRKRKRFHSGMRRRRSSMARE